MNRSSVRTAACTLAAAAVTAVLLAVPASTPSQAASFTLNDPNCSSFTWDGVSTLTCVTGGGGGGGGAFSCSISLSAGSPTVSTAETLTATCSNAAGAVTYTWTAAGGNNAACPGITQEASPNQNKADVAAPGGSTALNCTYNLSANDTATTVTPSKGISYAVSGGGGGGGGNISCNGFSATHVINASWSSNGLYYTANAGGFGPNDAVVVKFTTSSVTTSTGKGSFNAVEYSDPPTPRYGTLSDTACDFTTGLALSGGGRAAFSGDVGASALFTLVAKKAGMATLQPNTTYYINIANMPNACGGSCNMLITLSKVSGT